MELIIVTGMSGAGKSKAINALEDIGFYCVDNIPAKLIDKFLELCVNASGAIERVAIVVDVRSKEMFGDLRQSLDELTASGHSYKILFLECDSNTIAHRYKETRRKHPLASDSLPTIEQALTEERRLLLPIKERADYAIETTLLTGGQLTQRITALFSGLEVSMVINCMSFGFKHGIPAESDLVMDLRSLPNPFYNENLRPKTGLDQEVADYVFSFAQAQELFTKITDMADFLIPMAAAEGRSQFTIALGCTGGHHRSVAFAARLGQHLQEQDKNVKLLHRDIQK